MENMKNPDADTIARAIVAAAEESGSPSLLVAEGMPRFPHHSNIADARCAVAYALDGHWGRTGEWWRVHLGWSKNEKSARNTLNQKRRTLVHIGPVFHAARKVVGAPDGVAGGPSPMAADAITRAETRSPAPSVQTRPSNRKVPSLADRFGVKSDQFPRTHDEALKRRAGDRLSPVDNQAGRRSAGKPDLVANAVPLAMPFETALALNTAWRAKRLFNGGSDISSIKHELRREMGCDMPLTWIAQACVTDLEFATVIDRS
jgi:hypothetical protein